MVSKDDLEVPLEMEEFKYTVGVLISSHLGMELQTSVKITCLFISTHSLEGGDIVYLSTTITSVITTARCIKMSVE